VGYAAGGKLHGLQNFDRSQIQCSLMMTSGLKNFNEMPLPEGGGAEFSRCKFK